MSMIGPAISGTARVLPKAIKGFTSLFKRTPKKLTVPKEYRKKMKPSDIAPPKPTPPAPIKVTAKQKIVDPVTNKKVTNPEYSAAKKQADDAALGAQKKYEQDLADYNTKLSKSKYIADEATGSINVNPAFKVKGQKAPATNVDEFMAKYGPKAPSTKIKDIVTSKPLTRTANVGQALSTVVGGQVGSALGGLGGAVALPASIIKLITAPGREKFKPLVQTIINGFMASLLRDVGPGSKLPVIDYSYLEKRIIDLFNQEEPAKLPKPTTTAGPTGPSTTPGKSQGASIDDALAAATRQATADAAAGKMSTPPAYNPPVYNPPVSLPRVPSTGMTGGPTMGVTPQIPSTTSNAPTYNAPPAYNPPRINAPMGGMTSPVVSAVSRGIAPQSYLQPSIPQVGSSAPIPQYNPPTVATAVPQATLDNAVAQQTGGTNANTIELQKQNALNNLVSQYGSKENVVAATQQGDQQLALEIQQIEADYQTGMKNIGLVYQDLNNKLAALQSGSTQALSDVANQQSAVSSQLQRDISNLNLGGTSSTAMGGAGQQSNQTISDLARANTMSVDASQIENTKNLQNVSTDAALYQALAQSSLSQEALSGKSAARIGGAKRSEAERVRLAEEATRKAEADTAARQRLAEIAFNTQTSDLNALQQRGYQVTDAETQRSQYLTDAATQRSQQLQDAALSTAQKQYDVEYQAAVNAADSETRRAQDLQDMAYNRSNQLSDQERSDYLAQSNAALQRSQQLEDQNTARLQQLSDAELAQTQKAYDVEYQRQIEVSDNELARAQRLYDEANDRKLALSDQERSLRLAEANAAEARAQQIQDKADQRVQDLQDIAESRKFAVEQANIERDNTLTDTFNRQVYEAKMAKATRLASMTPAEYKAQYGIDASANLVKPKWYGLNQSSKDPNSMVPGIKLTPKGKDLPVTVADVNSLLDSFTTAYSQKEYTDPATTLIYWNDFFNKVIYNENRDQNLAIMKKYGIPTSGVVLSNSLYSTPKK